MKTYYVWCIAILLCLVVFGIPPALAAGPFTDNGDGTVTDAATELVWQQVDDGVPRNWADAGIYCTGLTLAGHSDWRLPEIVELSILADPDLFPGIDTAAFAKTGSMYWSGTTGITNTSAWVVNFGSMFVTSFAKYATKSVRCVRGEPASLDYLSHMIISGAEKDNTYYVRCVRGGSGSFQAPIASFTATPNSGKAPLTVVLDASASSADGTIVNYAWSSSDDQMTSGITADLTFNTAGTYSITLTVMDDYGSASTTEQTVTANVSTGLAHIEFIGLKYFYRVGETVAIELAETVHRDRFTRVDLWMVIEIPDGDLFFKTGLPLVPFSLEAQPYRTSIENTEASHRIFDFELPEGMGGDYILYALYVEEGTNPLTDGFIVQRSNLAIQLTTFANRKVRNH